MKKFRVVDIDQYEKLKSRNKNIFLTENFQLKRGANRAKLYNRYRKDLVKHFQPPAFVKRKTDDLIQELLKTKTCASFKHNLIKRNKQRICKL